MVADAENDNGMIPQFCLCSLASGSKGNAVYVSDGTTAVLFDAGLSGIDIERRLMSRGISPGGINAIIVSHEHIDHVRGVGVLSRRYKIPVYINAKTKAAALPVIKNVHLEETFSCGRSFAVNQLRIHPFSLSHDATDPTGFTVGFKRLKIGLATDLGIATAVVKHHLKDCDALFLEANHDEKMLETGPYPWPVKQRIRSRGGHLSNEASKILLSELKHDGLKHVLLGHLSETNNTPETAFSHVGSALNGCKARLDVALQNTCSSMIFLKPE
ncbi:MAG: MBL fold metallo-hydrolase [Desulfobacterales bacterium]